MALGARRGDVLKMIMGRGLRWVAIGLGIGLALGFLLTRMLASLLFGVGPTNPLTYIAVSAVIVCRGSTGLLPAGSAGHQNRPHAGSALRMSRARFPDRSVGLFSLESGQIQTRTIQTTTRSISEIAVLCQSRRLSYVPRLPAARMSLRWFDRAVPHFL